MAGPEIHRKTQIVDSLKFASSLVLDMLAELKLYLSIEYNLLSTSKCFACICIFYILKRFIVRFLIAINVVDILIC